EFFADDLKVLESGKPKLGYEEMLPGGNGDKRWVQTDKVPYFDSDGKPIGIVVMAQDVTERKNAEEAVRESNEKFHQLADNINDSFWIRSPDLKEIYYISPAFEKIWGRSLESVYATPQQWLNFILPEDREYVRVAYERLMGSAPTIDIEYRIMLPDGGIRWVRTRGFQVRNADGELIRLAGIVSNITEKKNALEDLEKSEERYRELVENALDIIYTHDLEGNYTSANTAAETVFGYSNAEILAMNIADTLSPEQLDRARQMMAEEIAGAKIAPYELNIHAKDGRGITIEVSTRVIYEDDIPVGIQGIARDITDRKRIEAAIHESERKYRELVELLHDLVWSVDADGLITYMSPASRRIYGREPEEMVGRRFTDFIPVGEVSPGLADLERMVATGDSVIDSENRVLHKDGHEVLLSATAVVVRDAAGNIVGTTGTSRDITDRKLADEALRESDEKFRHLADNISDAFWIRSPDMSKIYYLSPAYEQIWGRKLERGYADPHEWRDFIVPEDRRRVKDAYAGLMSDRSKMEIEFRILRPDREERWVRARGFQVKDSSGEVIRLAGIVTDITEKKRAETEIDLTLQRLKDAQRIGQIGDFTWDKATDAIIWSHEIFEIVGRDPKLGPPKDYEQMQECFDQASNLVMDAKTHLAIETGKAQEYELVAVRPDGERVYIQAMSEPIKNSNGAIVGLRGTLQNISTRKQAEAALEQSEFRYHSLFENMVEGYAYCETIFEGEHLSDFIINEVNGAFESLLGLKDVVGKKVSDIIPDLGESNPELFEIYGRVALTGVPEKFEIYLGPLGIWLSITAYSSSREQFIAVFDNITERKRAQTLLVESEQSLALATESASLGIWDWDLVEDTMKWDARMYELYGNHGEGFNGASQTWNLNLHPDDIERVYAEFAAAIEGPKDFHSEFRVVWPSGELRHLESSAKILRDEKGTALHFIGVNWDITERKQLEEQFRQSQKMEAVGTLAGGIAHDFNNMLTVINGYSDLTLRNMKDGDPLRSNIEEVKKAGVRAAELTYQLLAFSRQQVLQPQIVCINQVIADTNAMLERLIGENIQLVTLLNPNAGKVKADPGQLSQIIVNLAVNARDAMPQGGKLTFETSNAFLDDAYVRNHLYVLPGAYVKLTVSDNGWGMDTETQQHIFEPFFTTKEVGKGTGLGLATVYGIVKQSGGYIFVYSEMGHGTTFSIYLPRVMEQLDNVEPPDDLQTELVKGSETILLVEDEDLVRSLSHQVLESCGYTVIDARDGIEALEIFEKFEGTIDLLFTDVVMPRMGGSELAERLTALKPELLILFASGYTDDAIFRHGKLDPTVSFIHKPFNLDDVARKVRDLLDTKGG
ncbi:MAG: PAS domain S-box protein, partial [Pyrinomonadaceae bacterium]